MFTKSTCREDNIDVKPYIIFHFMHRHKNADNSYEV